MTLFEELKKIGELVDSTRLRSGALPDDTRLTVLNGVKEAISAGFDDDKIAKATNLTTKTIARYRGIVSDRKTHAKAQSTVVADGRTIQITIHIA